MSLLILACIIALLCVGFGGYFGFFGPLWKGYLPCVGIGLIVMVLILALAVGGV
jgi:hypothetical protein